MAKREADREDLFAEGVNFPQRGRLTGSNSRQWVIGWRNENAISVFIDQDPAFHFNTRGELRRAYLDGRKLAAEDGRFNELVRRTDATGRLSLARRILTASEFADVQAVLMKSFIDLKAQLIDLRTQEHADAIDLEVIGLSADEFRNKLSAWLADHPGPYPIAKSPGVE